METKKKQFKMPHTFVIIGIIILFAVLLTWIIPAGSYTRFENEAGIKVIDPNDFNYIDKTPADCLGFFNRYLAFLLLLKNDAKLLDSFIVYPKLLC